MSQPESIRPIFVPVPFHSVDTRSNFIRRWPQPYGRSPGKLREVRFSGLKRMTLTCPGSSDGLRMYRSQWSAAGRT